MKKFKLGQVLATRKIVETVKQSDILELVFRHSIGDWGDLHKEDIEANEIALEKGYRILSSYKINSKKIYIITEADRSYTTVTYSDEY